MPRLRRTAVSRASPGHRHAVHVVGRLRRPLPHRQLRRARGQQHRREQQHLGVLERRHHGPSTRTDALKQPASRSPPSPANATGVSSMIRPRGDASHSTHRSQNRAAVQPHSTTGTVAARPPHSLRTEISLPTDRYGNGTQPDGASAHPRRPPGVDRRIGRPVRRLTAGLPEPRRRPVQHAGHGRGRLGRGEVVRPVSGLGRTGTHRARPVRGPDADHVDQVAGLWRGCRTSTRPRACGDHHMGASAMGAHVHLHGVPPARQDRAGDASDTDPDPVDDATGLLPDDHRAARPQRGGPPRPPCQTPVSPLIASRTSVPPAASTSRCGLASRMIPLTARSCGPASGGRGRPEHGRACGGARFNGRARRHRGTPALITLGNGAEDSESRLTCHDLACRRICRD